MNDHVTRLLTAAILLAWLAEAAPAKAASRFALDPLFQDHAVLQRDRPIRVSGDAGNGEEVVVSLAGARATARADDAGRWAATLPARPAGGPHTLAVRSASGEQAVAQDVLIGDVFLCSGQSNMVLQVHRALDSRAEIAGAATDRLRMLTVGLATSLRPSERFLGPVEWQVAGPSTVADWSATCFYFARELERGVDVAVGMVVSAWGGSNIRAWMSEGALRALGGYDADLDVLRLYAEDAGAGLARWASRWQDWWRSVASTSTLAEPWSPEAGDDDWLVAPGGLGVWESWGLPELADFNGMVWYRATVRLTPEQAAGPATLSLGKVDEIDLTWFNGHPAGTTSDPGADRLYRLPAGVLRAGDNVIVVNVLDTYAGGGLYGEAAKRSLVTAGGAEVPLGPWRYRVVPSALGWPPRAPWEATGGMTTIHNAMIAPLTGVELRGVVWYQGESNTGDGSGYLGQLRGLMADWRARFGAELPFLIVQLASYGPPPTEPVESGWAEVREAQRLAAAGDPRAGLAVTIDIGDRYDIHPSNKQELGRRLARAARHVVYGEDVAPSGPIARGARREGDAVVVEFGDVEGGLVAYSADEPIGFELCGSEPGSCRFARARIDGLAVHLDAAGSTPPRRVRYCWADSPVCTLSDRAGLPAGPFEIAVE